jgi:hypothetical protein
LDIASNRVNRIMASKEFKKIILDNLRELLKPRGFKKSGSNCTKVTTDLTYFVNVQSSSASTAEIFKATLNLEIASLTIAKIEDSWIPFRHTRHWRARIGFFLDNPFDKWWIIGNEYEAEEASKEIVDIMEKKVLVEFDRLKTAEDLVNLWRNDKCPGLTDKQRLHYLKLVDTAKVD